VGEAVVGGRGDGDGDASERQLEAPNLRDELVRVGLDRAPEEGHRGQQGSDGEDLGDVRTEDDGAARVGDLCLRAGAMFGLDWEGRGGREVPGGSPAHHVVGSHRVTRVTRTSAPQRVSMSA